MAEKTMEKIVALAKSKDLCIRDLRFTEVLRSMGLRQSWRGIKE